jgi:hypothetical protein
MFKEIFKELITFLFERKKYFLIPIVALLLLMGMVLIFSQGSVIAPFIYTVF